MRATSRSPGIWIRRIPQNAPEVRHPALEPVATMIGDDARDEIDQAGSIRADDGHDE